MDEASENEGFVTGSPLVVKSAVAVGKGKSGMSALKWVLENEIPPGGSVYLVHVQSPLLLVPTPMGNLVPVDQVSDDIVKRFKAERFQETEKILDGYRAVCLKKKVKPEVCYSENASVQKGLVNEISRLGLTKLVIGKTSNNAISRAFKGESIATSVAKNAPEFCSIMVVHKGKLSAVKDAKHDYSPSLSRHSSISESSEAGSSRVHGINDNQEMPGSFGPITSEWLSSQINSTTSTPRHYSVASFSEPTTSFHHPLNSTASTPRHYSVASFSESTTSFHHPLNSTASTPRHYSVASFSNGNHNQSSKSDIAYPEIDIQSEVSSDLGDSVTEDNKNISQDLDSRSETYNDIELLDSHLRQAKLSAEHARREADKQENNLKHAEEIVAQATRMIATYKQELDDVKKEAEIAKGNAARQLEDAIAECEKASTRQKLLEDKLSEEMRKHKETQSALDALKCEIDNHVAELHLARQEAWDHKRNYEDAISKLSTTAKMLEKEIEMRMQAEERAAQEAAEKHEVMLALRRAQQRYSEYTYQQLRIATNNFSETQKLGEGGYGPVYKGTLHHTTVAVKVLAREGVYGREEFQREVELLSQIHHPHIVMLLGACPEKACIVYEYMSNGSLEDRLNCKDGTPPLPWYIRFRIISEVATALLFLHSQPQPVVHRDLKPGNILLDHNFVSKISDVGVAKLVPRNLTFTVTMYKETVPVGTFAYIDPDYQRTGVVSRESDVYALGIVMLQLLTGRPPIGVSYLVEEAVDNCQLQDVLDKSAGDWPLQEALEVACLGLQCAEPRRRNRPDLETKILAVLERIRICADEAAAKMTALGSSSHGRESAIPSFFLCPISQEIMENPCIAADGFTYEHDAIKAWLEQHNTSPMTNLVLNRKDLIVNHSVRSAIREWHDTFGIQK